MEDKRLFLLLSFAVIVLLIVVAGILIFFERGGTADFDILGQRFSSSNIGLAVLFMAMLIFVYVLREFTKPQSDGPASKQVYAVIHNDETLDWHQVITGIDELVLVLTSSQGFRPDLIVGICGGGLVVADIVSKRLGHVPCLSIWSNRHSSSGESSFAGQALSINRIKFDEIIEENSINRILVVDDVVYSGSTLKEAVEYLKGSSQKLGDGSVEIRTAALFSLTSAKVGPDFSIYSHSSSRKMMPASDRLRG